jgi:hypothetical protein
MNVIFKVFQNFGLLLRKLSTSVKSALFTLSKNSANGSKERVSFLKEKYFLRTDSKFVLELKNFISTKILFQTHIPHLSHDPIVFLSQIRGWILWIIFFGLGNTAAIQAASEAVRSLDDFPK